MSGLTVFNCKLAPLKGSKSIKEILKTTHPSQPTAAENCTLHTYLKVRHV